MAIQTIEGYVTVYETSDGGSEDPRRTVWQFFVDPGIGARQAVITRNNWIAETMRLAVKTASRARVTFDDVTHVMQQARIEFAYVCELTKVIPCQGAPEPKPICVTRRYVECKPEEI